MSHVLGSGGVVSDSVDVELELEDSENRTFQMMEIYFLEYNMRQTWRFL